MTLDWLTRLGQRLRIFWMMLAVLLLVSLLPIWYYHRTVLELSEEKLVENEKLQQSDVTRSLAQEVYLYEDGLHQQLIAQREILRLARLVDRVDDPAMASQVTALLESLVQNNPNDVLYVTAIGRSSRGQSAGSVQADRDDFVNKVLQRAFQSSIQGAEFTSDPLAIGAENRPAFVLSVPLSSGQQFSGMLAALVSLDQIGRAHV